MTTRVFYSAWQLQCCGDAFSIGDSVSWTAVPIGSSRPELGPEGIRVGAGLTGYVVTVDQHPA